MMEDEDPPLDEIWEAQLKESIVQDEALYLRILRYEVCDIFCGNCMLHLQARY